MLNLSLRVGGLVDPLGIPRRPNPENAYPERKAARASRAPDPVIKNPEMAPSSKSVRSPKGTDETTAFHPATSLAANDSMWSRLFRPFALETPSTQRFLPKLKAGRLMLEFGAASEWTQFEFVLAGSSIGDLGLYYYANKADQTPVGCIQLHSAHIDVLEEVLMVVTQDKTWFLCAEHGREASDWAEVICASIEKVSQSILLQGKASRSKRRRLSSQASHVTLREIQSREPKARVDEFLEIFVRSKTEDIRLQAMEGAFSWSCMRNIAWKLWLGVLPVNEPIGKWVPTAQAKRFQYESLRSRHVLFQSFLDGEQDDKAFIAACETSEDNTLYNIYKDVIRTRGSMDFFRSPSLQCMLIRILYTYSHAHPEISYNQGMGELLATIVYLLHIEQWPAQSTATASSMTSSFYSVELPKSASTISLSASTTSLSASSSSGSFITITPSSSTERLSESDSDEASYVYVDSFIDIQDDTSYLDREKLLRAMPFSGGSGKYLDCCKETTEEILRELTNIAFLEHDAYFLLDEIMDRMAGAYCPEISSPTKGNKKRTSLASTSGPVVLSQLATGEMASSPLYDQINRIHNHILGRCDPPTARHLSTLGVEPQMFLLRWVRVLMSREFEMAQVWQIWDAIFSLTPSDFSFINLLCVAAVREFRDEILQVEDPTAVLLCLRDLSEKVDADRLVDNARELYDALLIAAAVEAADTL